MNDIFIRLSVVVLFCGNCLPEQVDTAFNGEAGCNAQCIVKDCTTADSRIEEDM